MEIKQKTPGEKRLQSHEEQRKYPRIVVDRPVTLLLSNAKIVKALAYDISPDGMQIRCDQKAVALLKPKGQELKKGKVTELGISLVLPLDGKQEKVVVRCRLVYIVTLEEDKYAIGIHFTKISGESKKTLKRFIESSLEPE